jgi:hypothetical protein
MWHCRAGRPIASVGGVHTQHLGTEIRVDPQLAATTASRLLDASLRLSARVRALMPDLTSSPFAYGCLAHGVADEHITAAGALESTLERITAGLPGDADKLYALAFSFAEAEQLAIEPAGPWAGA